MRRASRVLLSVVTVAAFGASCGFPTEDTPTALEPQTPATIAPSTSDASAPTEEVAVWFVRDSLLSPRIRDVASPADGSAVVAALAAGVTTAEAEIGYRSAIPDPNMIADAQIARGTATVQLRAEFLDIPAGDQVLAIGEVVLTLTDLRGVGRVRFEIDGAAVAVPLPDGTSTDDAVSRDDFAKIITGV